MALSSVGNHTKSTAGAPLFSYLNVRVAHALLTQMKSPTFLFEDKNEEKDKETNHLCGWKRMCHGTNKFKKKKRKRNPPKKTRQWRLKPTTPPHNTHMYRQDATSHFPGNQCRVGEVSIERNNEEEERNKTQYR